MSDPRHVIARKALGQHFLHDEGILERIGALAAPEAGSGIVEIGPGTGNLTAHLLTHGCKLIAIERDRRLPAVLVERFGDQVEVMRADATKVDYASLLGREDLGPAPVVVGNLPYNVGTEILFRTLDSAVRARRLIFMLQREVALRLVAQPGTSAYGLLTIKVGIRANVKIALRVRPGAFAPPPRVESAVIVVEPLATLRYEVPSYQRLCRLLDAGFGLRRKTLTNALKNRLQLAPDDVRACLTAMGLDPRSRAETLSIAQWAELATALDPLIPANTTGNRQRKSRRKSA